MAASEQTTLRELARLFLRLGLTAFGGPAVHIAMMQEEVVRRRRWLSEERFLDLLSAANLIPGPNSTELAIHIGFERRRWAGLVVAGVCFILPAMLITAACGWAYVRYGSLPQASWLLYGVKPAMMVIVLQALWKLLPVATKRPLLRVLATAAAIAAFAGAHELVVLFGAGLVALLVQRRGSRGALGASLQQLAPVVPALALGTATSALTLPSLFWVFCKTGSVLFGSGYVLLAFLRADLVERLRWLTEAQLIDAIAVGQITPGPVFTTATFVGYVLAGPSGALVATAGIFLPAFVFVALSGPLVPRLRASPGAAAFLDGVNAASLALMALVTLQLGRAALSDLPAALIALCAALLVLRWKVNATWLVLGGALIGYAVHGLGLAH